MNERISAAGSLVESLIGAKVLGEAVNFTNMYGEIMNLDKSLSKEFINSTHTSFEFNHVYNSFINII